MCRGKIVTLSYIRNEWKTHSYSWSTNTLISYATWVILLHFPSQQDDGSLLLVDYHEIFMASFVCLCKPQKCHNSDPIQPLPSIYLFYLASQSLCSAQAVQFTISLCEKSLSFSPLNTGIFLMLTANWNSWPLPQFFSILTQILGNTDFLCNQHNYTVPQGIVSLIA